MYLHVAPIFTQVISYSIFKICAFLQTACVSRLPVMMKQFHIRILVRPQKIMFIHLLGAENILFRLDTKYFFFVFLFITLFNCVIINVLMMLYRV